MTVAGDKIASTGRLETVFRAVSKPFFSLSACFEAERDRWFLWSPVLVGLGIGVYFALTFEPSLWAAGLLLILSLAALGTAMRLAACPLAAAMLFCVALGFASASIRTALVSAPILTREWSGSLEGRVVSTERTNSDALSVILAPFSMRDRSHVLPDEAMPALVRLNIRQKDAVLAPGETIRLRARLLPPPEPVEPGGFDYARQIYFQRLGAVGFAYTSPEHLAMPSWGNPASLLAGLRHRITVRIQNGIGGAPGAVAAALVTGEERAIPEQAVEDLRLAGLSHVLSISGLHMALFGGSLFWLARAFFALFPSIVLRYLIKKWGAVAALIGSTFYLAISGAEVATQRSWIMISLMFVAILLDRPALSLRNVALAALIVLLWRPETLLGASFHMSFAAVVALISFYETSLVQRFNAAAQQGGDGYIAGGVRFVFNHFAGILLTTLVAGLATGVFAAFHFERIAVYSMAGNLGALPLVSLVIMPAALFALILMPFGLDAPALWLMGKGIEGMLYVAHEVASWQGADRLIASAPLYALLIFTLGGLWLALWRRNWRFAGIPVMCLGLAFWNSTDRPDLLIDREGGLSAIRLANGRLALTGARPSYPAEQWLRRDGDARTPRQAATSDHILCDRLGCAYREPARPRIAFPKSLAALKDDCALSDIVIAGMAVPRLMKRKCPARLLLDRFDFWREGAHAVRFGADGSFHVETSRQARGDRPWVLQRGFAGKSDQ